MADTGLIGEALLALTLRSSDLSAKFSAEMEKVKAEADVMGGGIGSSVGGAMKLAGTAILGIAGAAVVAAGATAKMASDFQRQMNLLQTEAGYSADDVKKLSAALLDLAPQVGKGPEELAMGLYHVASAGIPAAHAMDTLTAAAKLSAIGNADMEASTQAVIGVMAAYPQYLGNATASVGILNAIVGAGDMRMQGLAKAMATGILPAAQNVKLGLVDVGAALATLTDNVTPPDEAATRLRMTFALLEHQSHPAAAALEEIGIKSGQLGQDMVKPNGLLVAITDLKTHLQATFGKQAVDDINHYVEIMRRDGVDAANKYAASAQGAAAVVQTAFGGGRTSAAIETLLGEYDKFQGKYDQINKGANDFQHSWEVTQSNVDFQLKSLEAGLESLGIKIGTALLPYVAQFLGYLSSDILPVLNRFADWFISDGIPHIKDFGNAMSGPVHDAMDALKLAVQLATPVFDAFGAVLGPVVTHLGPLAPLIWGAVAAFGAWKLAVAIGPAVEGAVYLISLLASAIASEGVAATAAAVGTGALDVALAPLLSVPALIALAIGAVTFAVIEMYQHWDEFKSYISGTFMDAMNKVGRFFLGLGHFLGGAFMGGVTALGRGFSMFGNYMGGSFMGAMDKVGGFFHEFGTYIGSSFMDAMNKVGRFFLALPGMAGDAISAIPRALGMLVSWVRTTIPQIPYWFGYGLGLALETVIRWGASLASWAATTGGLWVDRFVGWVERIPGAIGGMADKGLGALVGWGANMVASAGQIGSNVMLAIGQFLDALPGRIWDALVAAGHRMATWEDEAASWAWNAGSRIVNSILAWFGALPSNLWNLLSGIIGNLWSWAGQMFSAGGGAGQNFVNSLWSWVAGLPGDFWNLGKDIINGLLGGITSMAHFLYNAVTGFFHGILDGAKHALGISSPSRIFAEQVGRPIAEGVALGITDNLHVAKGAIDQLTRLRPGGAGSIGVGGGVAGGLAGAATPTAGPGSGGDLLTALLAQTAVLQRSNALLQAILNGDSGVSTLGAAMRVT